MRDGHAAASAQAVGRQDLFARAALRVDALRGESYGAARAGRAGGRGAEGARDGVARRRGGDARRRERDVDGGAGNRRDVLLPRHAAPPQHDARVAEEQCQ